MEVRLDLPHPMETVKFEMQPDSRACTMTPRLVRGQSVLRVGYLTATGVGGAETKAALLFNAKNGKFTLQHLRAGDEAEACDFDLEPDEVLRRRRKERQRKSAGRATATTTAPTATTPTSPVPSPE